MAEDDHTWREKMERAVLNIPLTVTGQLSQPVVSMYKLINMQIGDTFPISIGEASKCRSMVKMPSSANLARSVPMPRSI